MLSLAARRGARSTLRTPAAAFRSSLSMSARSPGNSPRGMPRGATPLRPGSDAPISPSAATAVAMLVGGNLYCAHRLKQIDSEEEAEPWVANAVTSLAHLQAGRLHTLLTSTFSHATYSDLLLSVGGIVWFGGGVARVVGGARFLGAYAACGAASAAVAAEMQLRDGQPKAIFGASGAVNGMAVLYTVIQGRVTAAPLLYLFLRVLDTRFLSAKIGDPSRHIGHASGLVWGGLCAVYLRRGLRVLL